MTNREFYTNVTKFDELTDTQKQELYDFALAAIDKLDATNEKRKETTAKKALEREAERAPIRDAIKACITNEAKTATTLITEAGVEIKPQSIPSLLKSLVEDGTIVKTEVKVKGKGKQVGYVLA